MGKNSNKNKIGRVLDIYSKLINNKVINKDELAQSYGVDKRSIQRDISDIRDYLETAFVENGAINEIIYSPLFSIILFSSLLS